MEATTYALLALELTKLARSAIGQLELSDIERLPPEVRQRLLDERDQLNSAWSALAPKG